QWMCEWEMGTSWQCYSSRSVGECCREASILLWK
ncbi:hypothetical protein A2U01_0084882, partial [Trifolium medium]|nr:hypothetical protein [Trifolium medium]